MNSEYTVIPNASNAAFIMTLDRWCRIGDTGASLIPSNTPSSSSLIVPMKPSCTEIIIEVRTKPSNGLVREPKSEVDMGISESSAKSLGLLDMILTSFTRIAANLSNNTIQDHTT